MLYVAETWQCSLYRFHTPICMPPCRLSNIKWHICTWFHLRMRDHFKGKGLCSDFLPCVTVNLHCQLDWISNQLRHLGCGVSVGLFPEKLSKGGKTHAEGGWHHPKSWKKSSWAPTYIALITSDTLETVAHPTATMPPHPEELYHPKLWAETSFCLFIYTALVSNEKSNSYKSH